MLFRTFLKTGLEVLHLGGQSWESNAWPSEHWKSNPGRWRLYTPGIDAFLNNELSARTFGSSVDSFLLILEIADFESWGIGVAFAGPEGYVSYKPKTRQLWSVGQLNWLEIQHLTAKQQLTAFRNAAAAAIERTSKAARKPKDFNAHAFSEAVSTALEGAKVSTLSRAAHSKGKT